MSLLTKILTSGAVKSDLLPQSQANMTLQPGSYRGPQGNGMFFWDSGFKNEYYFSFTGHNSAVKAYQECAPLTAIINRKTQAYINGKTWVLNTRGKESVSPEAAKIKRLLTQPNPLQSGTAFDAQLYCYLQIFGWSVLFAPKPTGFTDMIDATAMWNIPPFMVDIEETKKLWYQTGTEGIIKSIVVNWNGERTPLPVEDCYIFRDFVPSFSNILFPESRIQALAVPINNIIGAYESLNTLINFRGAQGFLSLEKDQFGSVPMSDPEKAALQSDFRRYGLKRGQWQVIISNAALKWQQMGYPTKDLMLIETVENAIQAVCDSYNYPFRLLSNTTSNSLGGTDAGIFNRSLYQDTIIPEADSLCEQKNNLFKTADYNLKIEKDYSHVPVLQQDKKAAADARNVMNQALEREWRNGSITLNDWRRMNGDDPLTDERFTIYFPEYVARFGDPNKAPTPVNNQPDNNANQQQQNQQQQQPG